MSGVMAYATDYGGKLELVHSMIKSVADRTTPVLSLFLNLNEMVTNNKFEWVDKTLVGFKDTLGAALTSSTTTVITVASGTDNPKRYIDGLSLLNIEDEVLLVTSTITVVTNSSSYCVTRARQGTTASSHANASQVIIIGNPRVEGFNAGRDDSQKGVRAYNYTQIFQREAKLTGTSQHVKAVGDETKMKQQMAELTPELMKELQFALIHGNRYTSDATYYQDRQMGGFRWWAANYGTNTNKGAAISTSMIDDAIEQYLNNGCDADKLSMLVSVKQQRKINALKEARVVGAHTQGEKTYSNVIDKYEFNNATVDVIMSNDLRDDEVYFFQKDSISVHPMAGRAWHRKPLPEDGDFKREMVLGEYTSVFRNPRESLIRLYNLDL